jgi:hypothetical protein
MSHALARLMAMPYKLCPASSGQLQRLVGRLLLGLMTTFTATLLTHGGWDLYTVELPDLEHSIRALDVLP